MLTRQRLELLDAIEQTPEEYIPDLLNFVHLFHQQRITKSSSASAWDAAMTEISDDKESINYLQHGQCWIVRMSRKKL
jgi:L-rhamnose isomerase